MKVLFDTSILVASALVTHPQHAQCRAWMEAAVAGRIELYVSCHSLAEFYRVLTSVKASPAFTASQVWRLISEGLLQSATVVELSGGDYLECLQRLTLANERGGIVFDALIAQAAVAANVDHLLTLNDKHFRRIWPGPIDQIIHPLTNQVP